jgi:hypothetical protein
LTSRFHGPLELGLLTLSLLMFLTWMLPHWVGPWLESDARVDEPDLDPTAGPGGGTVRKVSPWVVWNGIVWILIFLVISRLFSAYVPGGLRALLH